MYLFCRYNCDIDKTYIICGGLGGFGLELADWLILRGCKNLVLTSRNGIKNGYQAYRISVWKSYGCNIKISTDNITTYEGCSNLIEKSNKLGPVHAIFNLAVVLNDTIFENQTKQTFKTSFGPKAIATEYLDIITRKMCPQLRDFVVFSSVSCGRGNAGQTNYGMANSIMERICEKRKSEGLPGLAIQWGAIGEVGLVADMREEAIEIEIGGTLQQKISNCLGIMDQLLKQNESAIVSSMVVAEKKSNTGGDNIVDAVANILGIKDMKSVPLQATLAEIGMDSMTGIEIKQTLDREYEVFLSAQDIKVLTFAKLLEIQAERSIENEDGIKKQQAPETPNAIIQFIPSEENATEIILPITGKSSQGSYNCTVIIFPGIDGSIKILEPLYKNIMANLVGLQYPHFDQKDTLEEMGKLFLPVSFASLKIYADDGR
ncbi:unnamed protein product [Ceutorhynchus assimilis]|uniref:Ketoreductase domain-containing protein n=1 Tax=Ceutorhynchus assimilis TaxID=467358 RepID=A0A9N9MYR0_9CUCU|nr:unnamed protein product [Ceutorhynchus assimilis]